MKRPRGAAQAATEQTVEALIPRLDELDRRLRDRQNNVADEMAARAAEIGESGSFDHLHSALSDADSLGALAARGRRRMPPRVVVSR